MSLTIVNAGEEAFLDLVLAAGYTLRLYSNDVTAGLTDAQIDALAVGAFTEATFAGYASVALTGGAWTTTPSDPSTGTYAAQTFTRSSTGTAQLIYGYYVTLTAGGALRWFEQFAAPVSVEFIADAITLTPTITLDDTEGNGMAAGDILMTGRATAAPGRLMCDGAAVSRTTYSSLFAAIGTAYGAGDGSTTFNVPNMQQRFPLGKATSGTGATLGATGGTIDHVHSLDTPTSAARLDSLASLTVSPRYQRRTGVTAWDANIQHVSGTGGTAVASAATGLGNGVALQGDTDTDNPPFQVVNYEIVT